jgi:hypothetical protein
MKTPITYSNNLLDTVVGRTLFSTYVTTAYADQVEHDIEESAFEVSHSDKVKIPYQFHCSFYKFYLYETSRLKQRL